MSMQLPETPPQAGGLPSKILGLPTAAFVLLVGGAVGLVLVLRSRAGAGTTPTPTVIPTIIGGGGGTTPPVTPPTPPTPAAGQFTQTSIIQSWIDAQQQLADLTTDAQKKLNRLGGSWKDIATFLIANPDVLANSNIRFMFTQIPAGYYTWILHISDLYQQAKDYLVQQTTQGYFRYLTLPQLVDFLRANPDIVRAKPEFQELVRLPVNIPAVASTAYTGGAALQQAAYTGNVIFPTG